MFRFIFTILLTLFINTKCYSINASNPVRIKLTIGSVDMKTKKIEAAVRVTIQDGWHIYYKIPGDLGLPTVFQWQENIFKDIHVHWPQPLQHTDIVSNNTFHSNIYKDLVVFPISLVLKDNKQKELQVTLRIRYAVCKDVCIPQEKVIILDQLLQDYQNQEAIQSINFWKTK
ncbi:protein-disulfide reductase DsbD domain-containing protein [Ehrlichia japonica]|nr:protein-disulfide reductase DsbD domain-containing protein [Ehrlichia japonica]